MPEITPEQGTGASTDAAVNAQQHPGFSKFGSFEHGTGTGMGAGSTGAGFGSTGSDAGLNTSSGVGGNTGLGASSGLGAGSEHTNTGLGASSGLASGSGHTGTGFDSTPGVGSAGNAGLDTSSGLGGPGNAGLNTSSDVGSTPTSSAGTGAGTHTAPGYGSSTPSGEQYRGAGGIATGATPADLAANDVNPNAARVHPSDAHSGGPQVAHLPGSGMPSTPVASGATTGVAHTSTYQTGPGTGHTGAMTTGQKISSFIPGTEANLTKKAAQGKI